MTGIPANCPRSDVDPFSTEFLADPYPNHPILRELGPAVWLDRYDVVAMARYREVRDALADWETFCSSRGVGLSDFAKEAPWRPPSIILEADPPLHTKARGVLGKILSRPALACLREDFSAQADRLAREVAARGEVDGIEDLAEAFPLSVFPDAVGLTEEGRENLLPYGDMAFNAFGPRNELFEKSFANAAHVTEWIAEQCRRENLTPDGIGAQVYTSADDGTISEDEAALLVRSLLTAGLDTTIYGIGAALYCLASFPDQWDRLREDPKKIRTAFDEAIRYVSPVQTFFRTTTRPVTVGDVALPEGQKVLLFLAAANRDPDQWDDPDRYDVSRKTVGHVGFGHGIHLCVGQMLAKLEAEVFLAALVEHVEKLELAGDAEWQLNNTLHGVSKLPLRLTAAEAH